MLSPPKLIRSFPLAHPTGFRSMLSIPTNAIVEDRRLAEFGEIPCFNVELTFEQALSLRAHLNGAFLEARATMRCSCAKRDDGFRMFV